MAIVVASSPRRVRLGVILLAVSTAASAFAVAPADASAAATPGHWKVLDAGKVVVEAGTPAVWEDASHHAWILWQRRTSSSTFTYVVSQLAGNGAVSEAGADIFAGANWNALSNTPTLLVAGTAPQVVFSGSRGSTGPYSAGCVYTATGAATPWVVGAGSLSANCANPIGVSAVNRAGVVATAFPGGWAGGHGVLYHVGVSAAAPASEADGEIPLTTGTAYKTSVIDDLNGSGDFSVAYAQEFSTPASGDGYYVQDVTAGGAAVKAPDSGTNSVNNLGVFANIAAVDTSTHPGVYVAYCSNDSTCKVLLWKVGAAKALTVPGTTAAYNVALSAGPAGRLWVAWYNESTNMVSVVRTNQADTKFGPVKAYATGCFEHGLIGLSSGAAGRLDVALQCVDNKTSAVQELATQSLVPLQITLSAGSLTNSAKRTLTVSVTDVGDRIKGAKVVVAGHKGTTNAKGNATIILPKGTKAGSYKVTVTATDYLTGTAGLSIKS